MPFRPSSSPPFEGYARRMSHPTSSPQFRRRSLAEGGEAPVERRRKSVALGGGDNASSSSRRKSVALGDGGDASSSAAPPPQERRRLSVRRRSIADINGHRKLEKLGRKVKVKREKTSAVDFESPEMLARRAALKVHPDVLGALEQFWTATDADGNGAIDRRVLHPRRAVVVKDAHVAHVSDAAARRSRPTRGE